MIRANGVRLTQFGLHHCYIETDVGSAALRGRVRIQLVKHLLLGGGLSLSRLFDLMYGDDPGGGPDRGPIVCQIMLTQIRGRLARAGLRVVRSGMLGHSVYELVRVDANAVSG